MIPRLPRSELLWLPIVVAALLVIYLPGLGNAPVYDDAFLTDGEMFATFKSWFQLRARMLSYGSFMLVQGLFGEGWWKQRLATLALHIGVVVALWALYREILRHIVAPAVEEGGTPAVPYHRSAALGLAIGFFALNPVGVYAVSYLIQRSIVMATFFVVLGLWLFMRALAQGKPALHGAAFACYVLAVMSKEHAIFAPLAALPLYILVARPSGRRLGLLAIGVLALIGIGGAILYQQFRTILGRPFDEFSYVYLGQLAKLQPGAVEHAYSLSILNQAYLFFHYGLRWFLPASEWLSINLRPAFPLTWATFPHVLGVVAYTATIVGGFFLVIRHRDWRALVGVSLLLPALLYPTEFATVWVQDPFVLYRSYLWAIGVPGLVFFIVHGPSTRVLVAIAAVVGGLLTWQALDRVLSMASPESVWTDAIRKLPDDPRSVGRWFPYLNRGSAYVDRNDFKSAMKDFEASSKLGDMGMGIFNAGALLAASGRHAQALAAFDNAQREGYALYNLSFQRGLSLAALGRNAEAFNQFELTRSMNPPSPTREILQLNLARVALPLGRPDEAIKSLEPLIKTDPAHKEGKYLLGMAYITKGEPARALEVLDKLVAQDPNARSYYARALANFGVKRKAEALSDIDNALRLGGANPHLLEWRGKILALP